MRPAPTNYIRISGEQHFKSCPGVYSENKTLKKEI